METYARYERRAAREVLVQSIQSFRIYTRIEFTSVKSVQSYRACNRIERTII